jgi:hypothetical protein
MVMTNNKLAYYFVIGLLLFSNILIDGCNKPSEKDNEKTIKLNQNLTGNNIVIRFTKISIIESDVNIAFKTSDDKDVKPANVYKYNLNYEIKNIGTETINCDILFQSDVGDFKAIGPATIAKIAPGNVFNGRSGVQSRQKNSVRFDIFVSKVNGPSFFSGFYNLVWE